MARRIELVVNDLCEAVLGIVTLRRCSAPLVKSQQHTEVLRSTRVYLEMLCDFTIEN